MGLLYACSASVIEKTKGGTVYRQVPSFVVNADVHGAQQSFAAGRKIDIDIAAVERIVKQVVNPTGNPAVEVYPIVAIWREIDHPHSQPLG